MLRRLVYVGLREQRDGQGECTLLASEIVDLDKVAGAQFTEQVIGRLRTQGQPDLAAVTLGRTLDSTADKDQQHQWRTRALEDATAIGGLRNPADSVRKLSGAEIVGNHLQKMIDAVVDTRFICQQCSVKLRRTYGHDWREN